MFLIIVLGWYKDDAGGTVLGWSLVGIWQRVVYW